MKEREKQQAIEDKRLKELKTVRKMIEIYCKGQHDVSPVSSVKAVQN